MKAFAGIFDVAQKKDDIPTTQNQALVCTFIKARLAVGQTISMPRWLFEKALVLGEAPPQIYVGDMLEALVVGGQAVGQPLTFFKLVDTHPESKYQVRTSRHNPRLSNNLYAKPISPWKQLQLSLL